jgi:putative CocE/NonD family hydrolase
MKYLLLTFCLLASLSAHSATDYILEDSVMVTTRDGAQLSLMVMRKPGNTKPLPALLQFTIYVRDQGRDLRSLREIADSGYVGVIAYARGKRLGHGDIWPYEHEMNDAYDVIDWISKQPWSNGSVGMFGGSYNGFAQWAACKHMHPALKTIVPYVANRPGMGLPMENNIFINPNYEWAFYTGNNRYLDTIAGNDRQRFRSMMHTWWNTGVAYNKMDSIDGAPNRWFQRWITHPDFDQYWQDMAPYGHEFKNIQIPVLAFDGYYNDSQNSGLYYLRQLAPYNPQVYLIIGPYSHFGAQIGGDSVLNGYAVDKDALIDTKALTFAWMAHIFKAAPLPAILHDKINYQVMGANRWGSAPDLAHMADAQQRFYLSNKALVEQQPATASFLLQKVDFANRNESNNDYYPDPVVRKEIDTSNGYIFTSAPFEAPFIFNGAFTGEIALAINKKDADIGVTLYELQPDSTYFHLSYTIIRASYAKDATRRQLLPPNKLVKLPLNNTHLVSKQISKGSRLVVVLNVNKNPFSQLNYGTGKDVSKETIKDAGTPLQVKWYNSSYIDIPVLHTADTIPFTMHGSRVYFRGRLNNAHEVNIQFDLGAGTQAVNKNSSDRLALNFDDKISVSNTQGVHEVRKSNHNVISIGSLTWTDIPLAEVGNMQAAEDIIIGNGMFEGKVIELDYDHQLMIVHDQLPAKAKQYVSHPVVFEQHRPMFQAFLKHNKDTFTCWVEFDTGRDGTMLIGEDFTGQNDNWNKLQALQMINGRKIVRLDATFGGHVFKDIVTNAADPAKPNGRHTLFGNQLLNHFNVILDNQAAKLYLQPNSLMDRPYSDYNSYLKETLKKP